MKKWLLYSLLMSFAGLNTAFYAADGDSKREAAVVAQERKILAADLETDSSMATQELPTAKRTSAGDILATTPATIDRWHAVLSDRFMAAGLPREVVSLIGNEVIDQHAWFVNPKMVKTDELPSPSYLAEMSFKAEGDNEMLLVKGHRDDTGPTQDQLKETLYRYACNKAWSRKSQKPTIAALNTFDGGYWGELPGGSTGCLYFRDEVSQKLVHKLDFSKLLQRDVEIIATKLSPQKKYALVICSDKNSTEHYTMVLFNARTRKHLKTFDHVGVTGACTSDEKILAYTTEGMVKLYDITKNTQSTVQYARSTNTITALAFSADNACLAIGFDDGHLALINRASGEKNLTSHKRIKNFTLNGSVDDIVFSPSNTYLAVIAKNPVHRGNEISIFVKGDCSSWQEMLMVLALQNAKTPQERRSLLTTQTFASLTKGQQDKIRSRIGTDDSRLLEPELSGIDPEAMVMELPVGHAPAPVVPVVPLPHAPSLAQQAFTWAAEKATQTWNGVKVHPKLVSAGVIASSGLLYAKPDLLLKAWRNKGVVAGAVSVGALAYEGVNTLIRSPQQTLTNLRMIRNQLLVSLTRLYGDWQSIAPAQRKKLLVNFVTVIGCYVAAERIIGNIPKNPKNLVGLAIAALYIL